MLEGSNLILGRDGAMASITLNRPEKLNPLDWATIRELLATVREIENDRAVRVITITGAGRAFSAGGDLGGYLELYQKPDEFTQFLQDFFDLCAEIEQSQKIYIAAVNGVTVAGGLELILACDLVLMAADATIGDGHINFAQLPGAGGSQRLPRTIGKVQAKRLILTGEMIDAKTANDIGLVTKVVPAEKLLSTANEIAAALIEKSPAALKGAKHLINHGAELDRESALRMEMDYVHAYATHHADAMEGLLAFRDKRPPKFQEQD